jgi:hypothetical protein
MHAISQSSESDERKTPGMSPHMGITRQTIYRHLPIYGLVAKTSPG